MLSADVPEFVPKALRAKEQAACKEVPVQDTTSKGEDTQNNVVPQTDSAEAQQPVTANVNKEREDDLQKTSTEQEKKTTEQENLGGTQVAIGSYDDGVGGAAAAMDAAAAMGAAAAMDTAAAMDVVTDAIDALIAATGGAVAAQQHALSSEITYTDSALSATSAEFYPASEYNHAMYVGYNSPADSPGPHLPYDTGRPPVPHGSPAFMYANKPVYYESGNYGYYCDNSWAPDIDYNNYFAPMVNTGHYSGGEYFIPDGGYMYDGAEGGYPGNGFMIDQPYFDMSMMQGDYGAMANHMHGVGRRGNVGYNKRGNKNRNKRAPEGRQGGRQPANEMRICGQTGELSVKRKTQSTAANERTEIVPVKEQASAIIGNVENWPTLNLGRNDSKEKQSSSNSCNNRAVNEQSNRDINVCKVKQDSEQNITTISFSSIAKKKYDSSVGLATAAETTNDAKVSGAAATSSKSKKRTTKSSGSSESAAPTNGASHSKSEQSIQGKVTKNTPSIPGTSHSLANDQQGLKVPEQNTSLKTEEKVHTTATLNLEHSKQNGQSCEVDMVNNSSLSKTARKKAKKKLKKEIASACEQESKLLNCPADKQSEASNNSETSNQNYSVKVEKNEKEMPSLVTIVSKNEICDKATAPASKKAFSEAIKSSSEKFCNAPNKSDSNVPVKSSKNPHVIVKKVSSECKFSNAKPHPSLPKPLTCNSDEPKRDSIPEESEWITVVKRSKAKKNDNIKYSDRASSNNSHKYQRYQSVSSNYEKNKSPHKEQMELNNESSEAKSEVKIVTPVNKTTALIVESVDGSIINESVLKTLPKNVVEKTIESITKPDLSDPIVKEELLKNRALRKENIKKQKQLKREAESLQKLAMARKDTKISVLPCNKITQKEESKPLESFTINNEDYPTLGARKIKSGSDQQQQNALKKINGIVQISIAGSQTDASKVVPKEIENAIICIKATKEVDDAVDSSRGDCSVRSKLPSMTSKADQSVRSKVSSTACLTGGDGSVRSKVFSYSSAAAAVAGAAKKDHPKTVVSKASLKAKKTVQVAVGSKHVKSSDKVLLDFEALIKAKPTTRRNKRGAYHRTTALLPLPTRAAAGGSGDVAARKARLPAPRRVVATLMPREKGKTKKMLTPVQRYLKQRSRHTQDLLLLLADIKRQQNAEESTDINTEGFREKSTNGVTCTKQPHCANGCACEMVTSSVAESSFDAAFADTPAKKKPVKTKKEQPITPVPAVTDSGAKKEAAACLTEQQRIDIVDSILRDVVFLDKQQPRNITYGKNIVTKELNTVLEAMMVDLQRFQTRQYIQEPIKSKARRRYICGIKDTTKKLHKMQLLLVASDVQRNIPIVVESLERLILSAETQNIPVVFGLSRRQLGYLCTAKGKRVGVVGIINYQGTEVNFKEIMRLLPEARSRWDAATHRAAKPQACAAEPSTPAAAGSGADAAAAGSGAAAAAAGSSAVAASSGVQQLLSRKNGLSRVALGGGSPALETNEKLLALLKEDSNNEQQIS